jgi:MFS family permease
VATGGTLAFTFSGAVLGPLGFGLLSEHFGAYRGAYGVLALVAAVAVSLLLWTLRKTRLARL